jgi:hypothetical protein
MKKCDIMEFIKHKKENKNRKRNYEYSFKIRDFIWLYFEKSKINLKTSKTTDKTILDPEIISNNNTKIQKIN